MTKLEEEARMRWDWDKRGMVSVGNGVFIECGRALTAAKLDNEAFYQQGVEDGITSRMVAHANANLLVAKVEAVKKWKGWKRHAVRAMRMYSIDINRAFRGARGIARVEIRQRLERLKGTDNG